MMDLIRRAEGTQQTLAKFKGKPFDWAKGQHCAALLRFHLKKLGHPVPPLPPLRSAIGARRALDQHGCADMADVMTTLFKLPVIAPAAMLLGDLVVLASEQGLGSVFVCAGHGAVFGWSEEVPRLSVWQADLAQFDRAFQV